MTRFARTPDRLGRSWLELAAVTASVVVLAVCLLYTALQLRLPSRNVPWDPAGWQVLRASTTCIDDTRCLQPGDQVLTIGGVTRQEFLVDRTRAILSGQPPIELEVLRGDGPDGRAETVLWTWGYSARVILVESLVAAGFPLLFWLAGTAAALLVRPRDLRWLLLVSLYFTTALLFAAGFVSYTQQAYSSYLTHAAAILFLPLAVHLHLILPRRAYPRLEAALPALWLASLTALVVDLFAPLGPAQMGLLVIGGLAASMMLLFGRLWRPQAAPERAAHRLMVAGVGFGILPWVVLLTLFQLQLLRNLPFDADHLFMVAVAGLMLPHWPLSYLWAIHRFELGRLELRANRALGAYGFWSLYAIVYLAFFLLVAGQVPLLEQQPVFSGLVLSLPFVLLAPPARAGFQLWVDRVIFGIRIPPRQVVNVFAARIPTALDRDVLRQILCDELLPALQVRRSALVVLDDDAVEPLYLQDVSADELPTDVARRDAAALERAVSVDDVDEETEAPRAAPTAAKRHPSWIRVAVPLRSQGQTLGLWYFGRRDPDDAYPRDDLEVLEQLSNQIAAVLRAQMQMAENRRLQSQLIQSQKMEAIGRLSAGVAHDFNNLLSAILGYSNLLLGDLLPGDLPVGTDSDAAAAQRREYVEGIRDAGEKAAALTTQLLAFSRQQVMAARVVDLNRTVRSLDSLLQRVIGQDIEVRTELADNAPAVCIDPGQMEQVLLNLVVNASDAMPEGGVITLRTDAVEIEADHSDDDEATELMHGAYLRLQVHDTGTGIEPELLDQIFEPFFTTKELGAGTGLGLSMVYGIVRQSGGQIVVDSTPNEGSTFSIYLPVSSERGEHADALPPEPLATRGHETILLVEDESSVRRVVADLLRGRGYRVLEAADGLEALEVFTAADDAVHLLLTDVMMPKLKGPELADRLLLRAPGLRVIYMSGYNEEAVLGRRMSEGGTVLVRKPFTPQALAAEVRSLLDRGVGDGLREISLFPQTESSSSVERPQLV
ncbi:MAG: ATP-binding protein [Acidobacteriota bacterium]